VGGGRRFTIWFLVILFLFSSLTVMSAAPRFTDLGEDHWARQAVEELVDVGLLRCYGDGSFRPKNPITRGQFINLLVKAAGIPEVVKQPPTFSDVNITSPYYTSVEAAAQAGIVSGDGGLFRPDQHLNREQLAVMVVKALNEDSRPVSASTLVSFADVSAISPWALSAVGRAVELGILSGRGDGFAPQAITTRAEAAMVIWNVWQWEDDEDVFPIPDDDYRVPRDDLEIISPTKLELTFRQPIITSLLKAGPGGNFALFRRGTAISPGPVRGVEALSDTRLLLTIPELYRDQEYTLRVWDVWTESGSRLSKDPLDYHFYMDIGRDTPEYIQNDLLPEVKDLYVSGAADKLEVIFSKPVTPETAEKKSNYEITLAEDLSREIKIDKVELGADSVTATLFLKEALNYEEGYRYFIKGIRDYLGGEMHPRADYFRWGREVETPEDVHISAIRTLSNRVIEIVFARPVQNHLQPQNYGVMADSSGRLLPVVGVEKGNRPHTVRLFLSEDLSRGKDYLVSVADRILDMDNEPLGIFTDRITAEFDSRGPRVEKVEAIDRRYFRLVFDKPVYRLEVELSGFDLRPELYGEVALVEARNKQFSTGVNYRLRIRAEGEGGVGTSGWQQKTLKISSSSKPPRVQEVNAATSHLVKVVFDRPLLERTAKKVENYRFTDYYTDESFYPREVEYDPATFTAHLRLPLSIALEDTRYNLRIGRIEDPYGNSMSETTERFYGVDTVPPIAFLPPLTNNVNYPLILIDESSPGTDYFYGEAGALEGNAYVKVSVDGEVVAVGQAGKDGSLEKLPLGDLWGLHTIDLELTDRAGNYANTSREYYFR